MPITSPALGSLANIAVVTTTDSPHIRSAALAVSKHAAAVANYCDHAEHVETVDQGWLLAASIGLAEVAIDAARALGVDVIECYAARLGAIEAANVGSHASGFDGEAAGREAVTWRRLQLVQLEHDRAYHPDVLGLSKAEQLRHYAFHLAKLAGAYARAVDGEIEREELVGRRLPDTLLFAIKLATVCGRKLPDVPTAMAPVDWWSTTEPS